MEYEKIKQLMDDMGNSKLTSISIDFPDGTKITMSKQDESVKVTKAETEKQEETKNEEKPKKDDEKEEIEGDIIKAPMVGTFYSKPSPTSDPYVEVGSIVKEGDTVCIVEAMKLMNEIETEFSGVVTQIFVEDGDTVEYGTPLFRIKK